MAGKLILLVEDDDSEAMLMQVALRKNGVAVEVTRAQDGAEALDILFSADENTLPSVVFLDLNLPKVNGLEVLERIRSQERMRILPVVILSGSALESDIRSAYLLGANSYVRKPVSFEEFSGMVKQLTSYWLTLNELSPRKLHPHSRPEAATSTQVETVTRS
jgi:CheY-like chemotaxis protein